LIRHAGISSASAILALTVPMIELSLETLLMAAVGQAPLLSISLLAAQRAAVALSPVAVTADPKQPAASMPSAKALTQNEFAADHHPRPKAGLDNGHCSWQGRTDWLVYPTRVNVWGPRSLQSAEVPHFPPWAGNLQQMNEE